MAYAGHQFGAFVPQLGDGRAILLGEVIDRYGMRRDIQLKGSGPTPFSRRGDGRAALGPVLRRVLHRDGIVENDHHAVTRIAFQRAAVLDDLLAYGSVVFTEQCDYVFRVGAFGEAGEVVACLSRTAGCAAYGQSIFYLGKSAARPEIDRLQPSIGWPPVTLQSTHEAALDVVDLCPMMT